jgi:hypothetical protein
MTAVEQRAAADQRRWRLSARVSQIRGDQGMKPGHLLVPGVRKAGLLACAGLLWAVVQPSTAADRYVRASVDESGRLRIETAGGRIITVAKERDESGFTQIAVSPDGDAVGWVGHRVNCCTSYDIPTRLVIYRAGGQRTFRGHDLPVWAWAFTGGGKQMIFYQQTVHGGLGTHYEWRDITSGRLIAE